MNYVAGLACHLCGAKYPAEALWVCRECLGPLEVTYDYDAVRKVISREFIESRSRSIWRYLELLPVEAPKTGFNSGFTPLVKADRLAKKLNAAGVGAANLHGGRSQSQRDRALHAFTTGRLPVLCATDVAARGIHVDDVACVVHFDPPADKADWVHRSGRTGRAGEDGIVVCLVGKQDEHPVRKLLDQLKSDAQLTAPDLELLGDVKPVRVDAKREPVAEEPKAAREWDRHQQGKRPVHTDGAPKAKPGKHAAAKARHRRRKRKVGA